MVEVVVLPSLPVMAMTLQGQRARKTSISEVSTLPRAFADDPRNKELVERIKAAKKNPSGAFVMPGYTAMQVLGEGLKKAGSQDPAKVADAIRATTLDTPIGQVAFDNRGDMKSFDFAVYTWHKDGSRSVAE